MLYFFSTNVHASVVGGRVAGFFGWLLDWRRGSWLVVDPAAWVSTGVNCCVVAGKGWREELVCGLDFGATSGEWPNACKACIAIWVKSQGSRLWCCSGAHLCRAQGNRGTRPHSSFLALHDMHWRTCGDSLTWPAAGDLPGSEWLRDL